MLVKVGDKVEAEQSLIVVEGDKASMEVPAPFAGTVKALKVATGDKVSTGSLIMVFEVEGAARLLRHLQRNRKPHQLQKPNRLLHLRQQRRKPMRRANLLKTMLTCTPRR